MQSNREITVKNTRLVIVQNNFTIVTTHVVCIVNHSHYVILEYYRLDLDINVSVIIVRVPVTDCSWRVLLTCIIQSARRMIVSQITLLS